MIATDIRSVKHVLPPLVQAHYQRAHANSNSGKYSKVDHHQHARFHFDANANVL